MKYLNGQVVLEFKQCYQCHGAKLVPERNACPRYNMPQAGKECPHCGSTRKDGHQYLLTGKDIPCPTCSGTGEMMESDSSYMTKEVYQAWWQDVDIEIIRDEMYRSGFNEQYFGIGYVYCCTDYGRCFQAGISTKEELGEWIGRDEHTFNVRTGKKLRCVIHKMGISVWERKN